MQAIIICIGDELLIGQTVDTNSAWISAELNKKGIQVIEKKIIGDRAESIAEALQLAEAKAELVLITGGLGPTKDDITKNVLCTYFGSDTYFDDSVWKNVERLFALRNKTPNELNKSQATLPTQCRVLHNEVGTAPGMLFEKNNTTFISMPGVPYEMKYIMQTHVLPMFKSAKNILHTTIHTIGIGESDLAMLIADIEETLPKHVSLAYLPKKGKVKLRLSCYDAKDNTVSDEINEIKLRIIHRIEKEHVFGENEETLLGNVAQTLIQKGKTLCTAESYTGGAIAHNIVQWSGASAFYNGGFVTYSNELKKSQLQVSSATLEQYGAVSEACVREMVKGALQATQSDFAIATSGIAGPTGATLSKPIGLVYIGVGSQHKIDVFAYQLTGSRTQIINQSVDIALNKLRLLLIDE